MLCPNQAWGNISGVSCEVYSRPGRSVLWGSTAASLLEFVNAIAEAIEKDHLNDFIDTLAYQYTRKPPQTIRPRRNVIVRLCSIESKKQGVE